MKHELGHALGQCHSGSSTTLMYYQTFYGQVRYVGTDAVNGNYYLYEGPAYNGPGPEAGCIGNSGANA